MIVFMSTKFVVPDCLICIHRYGCPCGYSKCNAACLTIYKPEDIIESEVGYEQKTEKEI